MDVSEDPFCEELYASSAKDPEAVLRKLKASRSLDGLEAKWHELTRTVANNGEVKRLWALAMHGIAKSLKEGGSVRSSSIRKV